MMRLFPSLQAQAVGAGLVLALAAASGCKSTADADIAARLETLTNKVQVLDGTVTQTQALVSRVDNSTNNFDRWALYLLILVPALGYIPGKIVWWAGQRWKARRNGGATNGV